MNMLYGSSLITPAPSSYGKARTLAKEGDVAGAMKAYWQYFDENPKVPAPLFAAALLLTEEKRYDEAVRLYRKIVREFEWNTRVWTEAAWRLGNLFEQEFAEMLEKDELLEHAIVYGQHKGIPKKQVREALASGKDVIMRIDVQGAATIRHLVPEAVFIFLTASSEEELSRRLTKRKTETSEGLRRRIATAREEMKHLNEFDYVVVNRDGHLDETVETIAAIITAEKCKVKQRKIELQGGVR